LQIFGSDTHPTTDTHDREFPIGDQPAHGALRYGAQALGGLGICEGQRLNHRRR